MHGLAAQESVYHCIMLLNNIGLGLWQSTGTSGWLLQFKSDLQQLGRRLPSAPLHPTAIQSTQALLLRLGGQKRDPNGFAQYRGDPYGI